MPAPTLYVVATPIGNLSDLSARAQQILAEVDLVAAEDTRHTGRLLQHFNINTRMVSVHDHNERQRAAWMIEQLQAERSIALVSDAGTPLISDPGYHLVNQVIDAGFPVVPVPGCCAFVAALSVAGLASDRFTFVGFLSAKGSARRATLEALSERSETLIFYESTHRIRESLQDMSDQLGAERQAVVARELTKTYETVKRASLQELIAWMDEDLNQTRGEFVVLVAGAPTVHRTELTSDLERLLLLAADQLPPKRAAALVAEYSGLPKKSLYQYLVDRSQS